MRKFSLMSVLFFLINAVQFNIVDDEGGGSTGGEGEGNTGDGEASGESGTQNGEAGSGEGAGSEGEDINSLPEWAQKQIKSLRTESASNRVKSKGLEDRFGKLEAGLKSALGLGEEEELSAEERIGGLSDQNQSLAVNNAILEVAIENGLNREQADYFGYLLEKAGENLEDEAELSEEIYEGLVVKAKGMASGSQVADTSVDGTSGTPPKGGKLQVTVEQFSNMGYGEKVSLRKENESLYNKLFNEARSKNLI